MTGVSPSPLSRPLRDAPLPSRPFPGAFPAYFLGMLWWGVLVLVGVGSGWCRGVCPVSRPGACIALRQPLRGGLRTVLRKGLRGGLRRALCPGVRPALCRRVMVGLGLPKFDAGVLGLLGKVGIKVPPRRGQQSLGEAVTSCGCQVEDCGSSWVSAAVAACAAARSLRARRARRRTVSTWRPKCCAVWVQECPSSSW